MQYKNWIKKITLALLLLMLVLPLTTFSESVEELEGQIADYEKQIQKLEREIAEQRKKVQDTSLKAAELESVVNSLNATQKKLDTQIAQTQNVIGKTETQIEKLSIEITDKQKKIKLADKALAEAVRKLNILENRTFFEMIFSNDTISGFTNDLTSVENIRESLFKSKKELLQLNTELSEKKLEEETNKVVLEQEQEKLVGQKESVEYTKREKYSLLAATKNEQARYESLLAQKEAQKEAFLKEMLEIESKLQILIDPNSFPGARHGILGWPVNDFVLTQRFGYTEFSKSNPQFYSTGAHNGIDLAIPIGTPVKAAEAGIIKGFDNTDNYPGCYSWGGWVVVEHDNGLSTLYAHLSSSIVQVGQRVEKGQTIAYSGSTGISTGPHLHFTLYASQGVEIVYYKDIKPGATRGCGATNVQIPIADLDAYLDPLEYLPQL